VKTLTNCFNVLALGQTGLSIYDRGDNVDEPFLEITTLADIQLHFDTLFDVVENYSSKFGFIDFNNTNDPLPL
jgi:hypothetical protein